MFQLNIQLDCNCKYEYLFETEETFRQIESALHIIEELKLDISLFPETLSRYGRSDKYTNNPKDIIVRNL